MIYFLLWPALGHKGSFGCPVVLLPRAAAPACPHWLFLLLVFGTRVSPFPVDNMQRISHPRFPTAVTLVEVSAAQDRNSPLAYFTARSVPEAMSGEISPSPEGQCQDTSISAASVLSVLALNLRPEQRSLGEQVWFSDRETILCWGWA